jgi:hypothetical protein
MLVLCRRTTFLVFLSLGLNCFTSAAKEKFLWDFDEKIDVYKKVGKVTFKQPGPALLSFRICPEIINPFAWEETEAEL